MNKYISLEFLIQNNPNPTGIQFKGIFGDRSIGKTHGLLKYLLKTREENTALLILRRNALELNFKPFVDKYSNAFDEDMFLRDKGLIHNGNDDVIIYYDALSLAERRKNDNFDYPYIKNIVVDEVFAEKPNRNEFQQLQTWISTVSRRTGFPFHPVTVWLLGNPNYGRSPILDSLEITRSAGNKQKTKDGVYLFSDMLSPEGVINVVNPIVKDIDIFEDNKPIMQWVHSKISYGLFDCGDFYYIMPFKGGKMPFTSNLSVKITVLIMQKSKQSLNPIFVKNYECLRFFNERLIK